jgi:hypothetical protein
LISNIRTFKRSHFRGGSWASSGAVKKVNRTKKMRVSRLKFVIILIVLEGEGDEC